MKISLEWKDLFNCGIEEVDYQHKYFLKLIKRFSELTEEKLETSYISKLLQEITYYALFHFCSEENIMMKYNYPEISRHRTLHEELVRDLEREISYLEQSKTTTVHLIAFLANWFMHHTVEEDLKFSSYLRSTGYLKN